MPPPSRSAAFLPRLFLLATTVLMPVYVFLVEFDAARYWVHDVNALVGFRTAINVLALAAAAISLFHLVLPRRVGLWSELAFYGLIFVTMFTFATGLVLVPIGLFGLVEALLGEARHLRDALWLLWPLGVAVLFFREGVRHPAPPTTRPMVFLATLATPFLFAASLQYAAWFLEKSCWQAVRGGEPGYLERVARCRPAVWFMSLDPLVMQYLRVTGHLRVGPVPDSIPPGDDPMAQRLAAAYRTLCGEELEVAALERFTILSGDPGHFQDPGE